MVMGLIKKLTPDFCWCNCVIMETKFLKPVMREQGVVKVMEHLNHSFSLPGVDTDLESILGLPILTA